MSLRMVDLYWTAGFLEGEGCFALCGSDARVQATQVIIEPLQRLQCLFGGNIYPKKAMGNSKPAHSWVVGGEKGAGLMMTLYPLMSHKRQFEITKTLNFWRSKGARFGALHYNAVASDEEALAIMQRIKAGESMNALEQELGISHTTMSMWMRGTKRQNLREALEGPDAPPPIARNKGAGHRLSFYSDEEVLSAMRRIRTGNVTMYRIAKELGITANAVKDWMSGKNRPYLLAQLNAEQRAEEPAQGELHYD